MSENEKVESTEKEEIKVSKATNDVLKKIKATGTTRVRIPLLDGEKKGAFVTVGINGCLFQIMKGESVEVPKAVEKVLINSKII